MKKIIILLLLALLVLPVAAAKNITLKVKVQIANVRAEPAISAAVVIQVKIDTLLEATGKNDSWYEVVITDNSGKQTTGYINASVVEEVSEESAEKAEAKKPAPARRTDEKAEPPRRPSVEKNYYSGGFKVMGGLDLASASHSQADSEGYTENEYRKRKMGFLGGFGFEMGQMIGLEINFLYIQKGVQYKGTITEEGDSITFDGKVNTDEVCMPVLLKFRLMRGPTPFIVAGGEIAYVLSNKVKWTYSIPSKSEGGSGTTDIIESTNRIDYGAVFGAGFEMRTGGMSLVLEARYHMGFANLGKNEQVDVPGVETNDWVRTNALVFTLGIKL